MPAQPESYAIASGEVLSGGRFRGGASIALMGDSLTADGSNITPFHTANAASGGRMRMLANCGVSAQTVSQMIARAHNSYLTPFPSPGFGGLPELIGRQKIDAIIIRAGGNDYRGGSDYPIAGMITLLGICAQYANHVFILSASPITNVAGNAASIVGNTQLQSFAEADSERFTFVDDSAGMRDTDGSPLPGMLIDDIHFSSLGKSICGHTIATALDPWLARYSTRLVTDPADVYPATSQWFRNPTNIYSGPPKTSGIVGALADNMSFNAPAIYGTCGIVPADIGDPNQVPWQRIAINRATATNSTYIGLSTSGRAITETDPMWIDCTIEVRTNSLNTAYIPRVSSFIQAVGGETIAKEIAIDFEPGISDRRYVLRNYRRRGGASAAAYMNFYLKIGCAQIFGPLDVGSIDFRCASARG